MFRRVRGARKDWTNGPAGTTTGAMEPRKYSTGTKGRIKMHCDKCREFIRANASFNLATEFIESIDPDHDEQVWQRFQTPADILPELQEWLGVGAGKTATPSALPPIIPSRPDIKPASQLAAKKEDAALQRTRAWIASSAGQEKLGKLAPPEAAEAAVRRFYKELTGGEP